MGIFGIGEAKNLEGLSVRRLRKERLALDVQHDQLIIRIKRFEDLYGELLDAASEPGLSPGEIDIAAYNMNRAFTRKETYEADLQRSLTRLEVLDLAVDVIEQKKEFKKQGIWRILNEMAEEDLEAQLENIASKRDDTAQTMEKIVEMLGADANQVESKQSPGFRKSMNAILEMSKEKRHRSKEAERVAAEKIEATAKNTMDCRRSAIMGHF